MRVGDTCSRPHQTLENIPGFCVIVPTILSPLHLAHFGKPLVYFSSLLSTSYGCGKQFLWPTAPKALCLSCWYNSYHNELKNQCMCLGRLKNRSLVALSSDHLPTWRDSHQDATPISADLQVPLGTWLYLPCPTCAYVNEGMG